MQTYVTTDSDGLYHSFNDEPAVIWHNGIKEWYKHGKRHRTTGAAYIQPDNFSEFWIEGRRCSLKDFLKSPHVQEEIKVEMYLDERYSKI
jgi:hypothetical protein